VSWQEVLVPLEKLRISPYNVRQRIDEGAVKSLMDNIAKRGLINPLIAYPAPDGAYEIVCGRLRFLAIRRLKMEMPEKFNELFSRGIPVRAREMSPREAALLSLSENVRQNTMTKAEIGAAVTRLREEFGMELDEIMSEVQLKADEIRRALEVYRAVLGTMETLQIPVARPGRPKTGEARRAISTTGMGRIHSTARRLAEKGYGREREIVEKLKKVSMDSGLSTREIQLLTKKVEKRPEVLKSEEELRKLVAELRAEEMVERVVLLRRDVISKLEWLAKSRKKTFDELLNELLGRAIDEELKRLGVVVIGA